MSFENSVDWNELANSCGATPEQAKMVARRINRGYVLESTRTWAGQAQVQAEKLAELLMKGKKKEKHPDLARKAEKAAQLAQEACALMDEIAIATSADYEEAVAELERLRKAGGKAG